MARTEIERIRDAVLNQRYVFSEHAYDEMAEDKLDVLDIEAAVLTGKLEQVLTHDPRGTRFVMHGVATDQETLVGVVMRFVQRDTLLVITVYQID
jgi:hypothetical protein